MEDRECNSIVMIKGTISLSEKSEYPTISFVMHSSIKSSRSINIYLERGKYKLKIGK